MRTTINIVVTCTKRKRFSVKRNMQLRTVGGKTITERSQSWLRQLRNPLGDLVSAADLYAGDHWSVTRSLEETATASGFKPEVWVCSAGYGLIPLNADVAPYAATFSPGFPDSITRSLPRASTDVAARIWWKLLTKWRGPKSGCPRSIESLARRHPKSPILIVASSSYLAAIQEDIEVAVGVLKDAGLLMIFSGGPGKASQLVNHCLPCNAVLQRVVGGARTSLNVRLARRILERIPPDRLNYDTAKNELRRLIGRQPKLLGLKRQRTSDNAIRAFIVKELKKDREVAFGSLLRQFRDQGSACEYSRFRTLFRRVQRENLHA